MKKFNKSMGGRLLLVLVALGMVVTSCVYLDEITYPEQLVAGEFADFVMEVHVEPETDATNEKLIIAVLMPTSWNPANSVTLTYTSSEDEGVQTMTVIPDTQLPANGGGATWPAHLHNKFGVGPNVNENMVWVAFQSTNTYNFVDGDMPSAVVTIHTLIGTENLRAQLGFFVNHSSDGLSTDEERWKVQYSDCMPVTGATGTQTNYCDTAAAVAHAGNKVSGNPYPNPFTDKISFPLNLNGATAYEVNVYDVTGKKVKSYKGTTTAGQEVFTANTEDLTAGLYIVSVKSDKGLSNFKVVKK